jgi:hypothetical protein
MQTVHILQLDSADTDSLPKGEFLQGNLNLLPNNLARQQYRYTSVPRIVGSELGGGRGVGVMVQET